MGTNDERDPVEIAEKALARFKTQGAPKLPLRDPLAAELTAEARPAVHALLFATSEGECPPPTSLEHHETMAMTTLLGRRLAILGGTPTAALRLAPALLEAVRAEGWEVHTSLDAPLQSVLVEGYVRGREERLIEGAARDAVARIPMVPLCEGCLGVFPCGVYDPELLRSALEELGRILFKGEYRSCLLDVGRIEDPTLATVQAIMVVDENARMIGATAVMAGLDDQWRRLGERAGLRMDAIVAEDTLEEGLRNALSVAGYGLRRVSWLPAPLRPFFR